MTDWLNGNGGFVAFLLCLVVLGVVEWAHPAFSAEARRHERWPTNFGIGILNLGLAMIVPVSAVFAAQWAKSDGIGLLHFLHAPLWIAVIVTLLLRSLAGYLLHRAEHTVRALWRIHRIHHCDTHIDVSTSLRNHPLELIVLFCMTVPLVMAFGLDPLTLAAYEIGESMTNAFAHANIRLPEKIDRALRLIFVTPNMHCLHHSAWQPETDSNYGQLFSFWDRLFGTYSVAPRAGYDAMKIGLNEIPAEQAADIVWQMKLPALPSDLRAREASPSGKSVQP